MVSDEITVEHLKQRMDNGEELFLLDVREPRERDFAGIGGALIPLSFLETRYTTLDPEKEIVVYCHYGGRSLAAVNFLKSKGFRNVKNLVGGIDAWSARVDASVRRY